jgi:hypothetical protein
LSEGIDIAAGGNGGTPKGHEVRSRGIASWMIAACRITENEVPVLRN